jgi:hypothetical protein
MSKLTDSQIQELIEWIKAIYLEVDDVEFPDLLIDKCYDFALENNDVPEEFLPETMPFGKYLGVNISELSRGYIETLLTHKWKEIHPSLNKALRNQLREIEFIDEYVSSLDDYSIDDIS